MKTVKLDGFCECIECGKRIEGNGYIFKGFVDEYGCKECAEKTYEQEPTQ